MKLLLFSLAGLALLAIGGVLVFVYVIQNVEQPAYTLVEQDREFELRDYPALVVAEVQRKGNRQQGLSAGFGPLARYIFAKERADDVEVGGERIAMTAPVVQQALAPDARIAMTAPVTQRRTEGDAWAIRFIMPAQYRLAELPAPAGDDVRLSELAARRVAAVRFSGRTTDALIAEREQALREWMANRELRPAAEPTYAYYNDPFTPGFLRRNEVLIDVASNWKDQ
ncbi:MAG: heme-binding protein [Thiohalocapsa sp.]